MPPSLTFFLGKKKKKFRISKVTAQSGVVYHALTLITLASEIVVFLDEFIWRRKGWKFAVMGEA